MVHYQTIIRNTEFGTEHCIAGNYPTTPAKHRIDAHDDHRISTLHPCLRCRTDQNVQVERAQRRPAGSFRSRTEWASMRSDIVRARTPSSAQVIPFMPTTIAVTGSSPLRPMSWVTSAREVFRSWSTIWPE